MTATKTSQIATVLFVVAFLLVAVQSTLQADQLPNSVLISSEFVSPKLTSTELPSGELPIARSDQLATGSVWLVNTRHMPTCRPNSVAYDRWLIQHQDAQGHWEQADVLSLIQASRPDVPCVVFVHGNLTDPSWAIRDGLEIKRTIEHQTNKPIQLIIWSWPSERQLRRFRRDTVYKSQRAEVDGIYLSRLMHDIRVNTPVTMIGYSFGARTVCGAVELLAGGQINGVRLNGVQSGTLETADDPIRGYTPEPTGCEMYHLRLVLIAAAIDYNWLVRGHRYGRAVGYACETFVTRNSTDNALRWYPLMNGIGGPKALGQVGPALSPEDRNRVQVVNVSCSVLRRHDLADYLRSPAVSAMLEQFTFSDIDSFVPGKKTMLANEEIAPSSLTLASPDGTDASPEMSVKAVSKSVTTLDIPSLN